MTTPHLTDQLEQARPAVAVTDYTQAMTLLEGLLADSDPDKTNPTVQPTRWQALREYGRLRGIAAEILQQIIYPIEDEALRQKFFSAAPVKEVLNNSEDSA